MVDRDDLNRILIRAVENGDFKGVKAAVESGAEVSCITPAHIPPLKETDEHYEIMRYLFSLGYRRQLSRIRRGDPHDVLRLPRTTAVPAALPGSGRRHQSSPSP